MTRKEYEEQKYHQGGARESKGKLVRSTIMKEADNSDVIMISFFFPVTSLIA